mmetsp:Transcript_5011/g.7655  ORF Transcript_5011/g.7655 Transcript_5011/m.7655 type:complete len:351 (-) Transcript_5011:99-1151(-)
MRRTNLFRKHSIRAANPTTNSDDSRLLTEELINEFSQIQQSDADMALWKYLPVIYPPFIFKKRIIQLILFSGPGLKSIVMEEFGLHILVEALLVTIICTPILSETFTGNDMGWEQCYLVSLFFITANVQLISLVNNIIWVCSFAQIGDAIFQVWMSSRVDVLVTSFRIHSLAFYLFAASLLSWPLIMYPYPFNLVVAAAPICLSALYVCRFGPLGGAIMKSSNPILMCSLNPRDTSLQNTASTELQLLMSSLPSSQVLPDSSLPTVHSDGCSPSKGNLPRGSCRKLREFLASQGLEGYTKNFTEHNIEYDMLRDLSAQDYIVIGVSIGHRIIIERALNDADMCTSQETCS